LKNIIISMDGPAGSGKQRIAKYIAKKYKLYHLDSGNLYRRLAYIFTKKKINIKKNDQIYKIIKSIKILSSRGNKILRREKISLISSQIAKLQIVRNFINIQQKKIVKNKIKDHKGVVIDGRDIGSKVFKNAKIKLFIQVSPEIRAKRRHKQLIELGEKSIYAKILKEMNLRDKVDMNRKESPLIVPNDAYIIDNSHSFKTTIKQINKFIKR